MIYIQKFKMGKKDDIDSTILCQKYSIDWNLGHRKLYLPMHTYRKLQVDRGHA